MRIILLVAVLIQGAFYCDGAVKAAERPQTIALTFDDLPYVAVADGDPLRNAERVTQALLDTLATYHAPATAFVNSKGRGIDDKAELVALLQHGRMLGSSWATIPTRTQTSTMLRLTNTSRPS